MKIEVINTRYPHALPDGTIMTVAFEYDDGAVEAIVDGGDGHEWYVYPDMYRPIQDFKREVCDTTTTGTLAELNVKPGDVVKYVRSAEGCEFQNKRFMGALFTVQSDGSIHCKEINDGFLRSNQHTYTIISRASDEPTFDPLDPPAFGELTDAQKVDIMLHFSRGGATEFWSECHGMWKNAQRLSFYNDTYYRKKPEHKRETVTLRVDGCGFVDGNVSSADGGIHTHRITFDTFDGKPICDSIKMEEL